MGSSNGCIKHAISIYSQIVPSQLALHTYFWLHRSPINSYNGLYAVFGYLLFNKRERQSGKFQLTRVSILVLIWLSALLPFSFDVRLKGAYTHYPGNVSPRFCPHQDFATVIHVYSRIYWHFELIFRFIVGNHSCEPNAEVTFPYNNSTLVLKALHTIQRGEVQSSVYFISVWSATCWSPWW